MDNDSDYIVLISANAEWQVTRSYFNNNKPHKSPYGEWLEYISLAEIKLRKPVVFFHGGWGKVASAGSTQYVISRWHPKLLLNLGTCGGFKGMVNRGEIILVERTIIYDIYEQMGDPEEHIRHYTTDLDNSWISEPLPIQVRRTVLASGDRDLFYKDLPELFSQYGAIAGDWESGAIAWVAARNQTRCLILRGVTDLVGEQGGEAYVGGIDFFYKNTTTVMKTLLGSLPGWLIKFEQYYSDKDLK
jgi:adenosylhomocysteine nucleosidase